MESTRSSRRQSRFSQPASIPLRSEETKEPCSNPCCAPIPSARPCSWPPSAKCSSSIRKSTATQTTDRISPATNTASIPRIIFIRASTIKLAGALLALEKLNQLGIAGVDRHTPVRIDSAASGQTAVREDPTAPDGLPTIAHYIRKLFAISDNDAYNRLYEFVGQQRMNEGLWEKGYRDVRLTHRLAIARSPEGKPPYKSADVLPRRPSALPAADAGQSAYVARTRADSQRRGDTSKTGRW